MYKRPEVVCCGSIVARPNRDLNRFSSEWIASKITLLIVFQLLFAFSALADKAGTDLNQRFFIEFKPPFITVKAAQVPLSFLLDQIAQRTGIDIAHAGIDNRPATVDFSKIPLERGIGILLKGYDVAWTYQTNSNGKELKLMGVLVVADAAGPVNEREPDIVFPKQEIVPEYDGEDLAAAEVSSSFEGLNVSQIEAMLDIEPDPALRARLLLQIGNPPEDEIERATSLLKMAIQDIDPDIRVAALNSLSVLPQEMVEDSIVGALNDPAPEVRSIAFSIAGSMALINPLDLIYRGLADMETEVRSASIEAIGGMESPNVLQLLTVAAEDPDASVRTAALEAIRQLEDDRQDEPDQLE